MVRRKPTLAQQVECLKAQALCAWCGEFIGKGPVHWDHVDFNALGGTNAGANLSALHPECHHVKTYGTSVPLSGDISKIAKVKRIARKEEEFQRRLLAKAEGVPKEKSRWPSRKFGR